MLNPDIHNTDWRRQREQQWKLYESGLKQDMRRKEIAELKKVFMGDSEFRFGNAHIYGEAAYDKLWGLELSPIQTPESWTRWITITLPAMLPKSPEQAGRMFSGEVRRASGYGRLVPRIGWDVVTEVEIFDFMMGSVYESGVRPFYGREVRTKDMAWSIHRNWVQAIRDWLVGYTPVSDIKESHLLDYWMTTLPYLHEAFFATPGHSDFDAGGGGRFLKEIFLHTIEFDLEAIKHKTLESKKVALEDCGERQRFLEGFRAAMGSTWLPVKMKELWDMANESPLRFREKLLDRIPEEQDLFNQNMRAFQQLIWHDQLPNENQMKG